MPASLLIPPRLQFTDQNGVPLAGGLLYSYAAGTTTPLATYTDSTGSTAAPNPVVLDAGGSASVWLGQAAYKLVLQNAAGVQQWSVDGVSSVSLAEMLANNTFASITVTGNASVGGSLNVAGSVNAGALAVTGAGSVGGAFTAATLISTGTASVGGALDVSGATSLEATSTGPLTVTGGASVDSLTIGATALSAYVLAQIPALSAVAGTLVISSITASGGWILFTFGGTAGTRTVIAFGSGTVASGGTITLPTGFNVTNFLGHVSMNNVNDSGGNGFDGFTCSLSGLTVTATGKDNSGHTYNGTANWFGVCWATGV